MKHANRILLTIRKSAHNSHAAMAQIIKVPVFHIIAFEQGLPCRSDAKITKWVESVA